MVDAEESDLVQREKRSLRHRLLSLLGKATLATSDVGCAALGHLELDERWRRATTLGLFAATESEPDTRPILVATARAGRVALFPRCRDDGRLEFAPAGRWSDLRPGRYGLAEPTSPAARGHWRSGDVVLVPGVAFDCEGGRLGRGRGYYDRTFVDEGPGRPWLLGLAFELQMVERVPMGPFDRRVDGVVTESGVRWFGPP